MRLLLLGCEKKFDPADRRAGSAQVIDQTDSARVTVDHPEQFPLVAADPLMIPDQLNVTGIVNPDISREVPVISLASGRIVDIRARLDDNVRKRRPAPEGAEPGHHQRLRRLPQGLNDELLAKKTP